MRKLFLSLAGLALFFSACNLKTNQDQAEVIHVITEEKIESMTPDQIIDSLIIGNRDFAEHHLHEHDYNAQLMEAVEGQHPMAFVLSCIDSRVPVETIFDMGIGDLFIGRIAGNVISPDVLASMEYACEHAGAKVIVILGHESCGAVHAAVEGVEAGNMTQLLDKIKPAIDSVIQQGVSIKDIDFEQKVTCMNVELMLKRIPEESEILAELIHEGKIKIVGAFFNLHTGIVTFLDRNETIVHE